MKVTNLRRLPREFAPSVTTLNFYAQAGSGVKAKKKLVKGKELFLLHQPRDPLSRGAMLLHLSLPENQIAGVLATEAAKWQ